MKWPCCSLNCRSSQNRLSDVCLFLFLFPLVSVLLLAMVGRNGCWTAAAGATTLEVLALPATAEGETDAETEPTGRRMASPTNKLMFDNAARSC